jgi:hypothetical protein
MDLWVPITVAAALLQCLRTAQQKVLKVDNGVNYARYIYGAPIGRRLRRHRPGRRGCRRRRPFLFFCLLGGSPRSSRPASSSSPSRCGTSRPAPLLKTETVQTAILATIFLGPITLGGWVAIVIGLAGVLTLSVPKGADGWRAALLGITDKAALYGLASGGLFGVSAIGIRGASLSLGDGDFVARSLMTLASVTALQTVLMTLYLQAVERGDVVRVLRAAAGRPVGIARRAGLVAGSPP